ncbi:MAG: single-stranded-DNA-specific exonuclease RecJ [Acidobacteriaceae bacterium]
MRVPRSLLRVFEKRGITNIDSFLAPSTWSQVPHPLTIPGMVPVVARIVSAIQHKESIAIHGDYDCDGVASCAILKATIELCGHSCLPYLPHRDEGYGLSKDAVLQFAKQGIHLIVTVDNGIAAHEPIHLAKRLGIDVVVIDHHSKTTDPEDARAIVWDPEYCAGSLTLMAAWGILEHFHSGDKLMRIVDSLNRLGAIASIADSIPLTGTARTLTRLGLASLPRTQHAGLRALLSMAYISGVPSASQLAFSVIPTINAVGRVRHPSIGLDMLCARDDQAVELAQKMVACNRERREIEQRCFTELVESSSAVEHAYVGFSPEWPKGIVGILASRAVEHFGVPAFVLGLNKRTGMAVGSGRSVPGFSLIDALDHCSASLTRYGGHPAAAGVTLEVERIPEFQSALAAYASQFGLSQSIAVEPDADLEIAEITSDFKNCLAAMEPFGVGNPAPIFRFSNVEIYENGRTTVTQNGRSINVFTRKLNVEEGAYRTALVEMGSRANVLKAVA